VWSFLGINDNMKTDAHNHVEKEAPMFRAIIRQLQESIGKWLHGSQYPHTVGEVTYTPLSDGRIRVTVTMHDGTQTTHFMRSFPPDLLQRMEEDDKEFNAQYAEARRQRREDEFLRDFERSVIGYNPPSP
jgi:hypothetical protein